MMSSAGKAHFLRQDVVGARADFDAALERIGLAALVEGHDDRRGSVAMHQLRALAKDFLAFLEAERIHDGLAGRATQSRLDHAPLRAVDHERRLRDVGLRRDEIKEVGHRLFAVEHALVEIDVDDRRATFHLLPRDGDGLLEFALEDQLGELRRGR